MALVVFIAFVEAAAALQLSTARTNIAAAVGGTITYFAGGECVPIDLTNRELLLSILSIFASPPPTLCLTCALRRSGGTASAVVDYIDWSVQPATVLQLRQMNFPRKEAAAAYTAGNLVVGGG